MSEMEEDKKIYLTNEEFLASLDPNLDPIAAAEELYADDESGVDVETIDVPDAINVSDPNEDLIGFEFTSEGKYDLIAGLWKVTKTPVWSDGNYVEVVNGDLSTVALAGLVRNRMHAETDAELIGHAQDAKDALDADS